MQIPPVQLRPRLRHARPAAGQSGAWTYAYIEGVATATQRDDGGRVTATLTCRPPTGDIVIHDYRLGNERAVRRATTAAVRIGVMSVNVPMTLEGRGRNRVVENWSWKRTAERTVTHYRALLDEAAAERAG
mgnify:CR=1 FL=1